MAECCVVVVPQQPNFPLLARNAIEADQKEFFIQAALSGLQASIASVRIHSYSLLEYVVLHAKDELYFYFIQPRNQWITHLAIDLNRLCFYALVGDNFLIAEHVLLSLKATGADLAQLVIGRTEIGITKILHLVAAYCKSSSKDLFRLLLPLPGMAKPEDWSDTRSPWVDSAGNNPLHHAAKHANLRAVKYLIEELHISPLIRNAAGNTAWDLVSQYWRGTEYIALRRYIRAWKHRQRSMLGLLSVTRQMHIGGQSGRVFPDDVERQILSMVPTAKEDDIPARTGRCTCQ